MRKAFVSVLLAFLPCLCLAQNESATLSGRVSDPTSAAVVGEKRHGVLRRGVSGLAMLVGRSLFPLLTVAIIAGTALWGPWVTLVLAVLVFGAVSVWA